ncbi:hypothetical protein [Nocardia miyunensis]|uniref:hypothetical protein n=1 Tax=Nocardia miyunensis TaxID=282684 RepID=UPI000833EB57|nr:hypothetical protein [Nocardia miyunensis]
MSGTAEPVRRAKTDAEWARDTDRRINSVENPTSQRVGQWVISTSPDGNLIASHVEGGSVILARKPEGGENDPDTITDTTAPACTVTRTANQSITSSGAAIMFDGTAIEVGGNWTGGKRNLDSVIVPVSGVYNLTATAFFDSGRATLSCAVMVNGNPQIGGRINDGSGDAWMEANCAGQVRLNAGDNVSLVAVATGVTRNVGAATVFTTPVPTSMSLSLIVRT